MSQSGRFSIRDCFATAGESNRLLRRHRCGRLSPPWPTPPAEPGETPADRERRSSKHAIECRRPARPRVAGASPALVVGESRSATRTTISLPRAANAWRVPTGGVSGTEPAVELAILALLEQHGSLAYEQVTAHLGEPPNAVRSTLQATRERGLIDALGSDSSRGRSLTMMWRGLSARGVSHPLKRGACRTCRFERSTKMVLVSGSISVKAPSGRMTSSPNRSGPSSTTRTVPTASAVRALRRPIGPGPPLSHAANSVSLF
jgi:DNA-binding transcriptional ArsR family regulator